MPTAPTPGPSAPRYIWSGWRVQKLGWDTYNEDDEAVSVPTSISTQVHTWTCPGSCPGYLVVIAGVFEAYKSAGKISGGGPGTGVGVGMGVFGISIGLSLEIPTTPEAGPIVQKDVRKKARYEVRYLICPDKSYEGPPWSLEPVIQQPQEMAPILEPDEWRSGKSSDARTIVASYHRPRNLFDRMRKPQVRLQSFGADQ
jgi:hypothetical protein